MALGISAVDDRELERVAGGRYVGPTFVYIVQEGDTLPLLAQLPIDPALAAACDRGQAETAGAGLLAPAADTVAAVLKS